MKEGLLPEGSPVITGVSGGADSICLFFVLQEITQRLGCSFSAVHVHHGIRGEEADLDEAFVRQICEEQGVPLRVFHGDVPDLARKEHLSLEEAGRRFRYACLEEAAGDDPDTRIAVAHHLDDQCETVLMNLLRGSSIHGMCGMPVKRGRIIRPLLCADRSEIEAFLERNGLNFRTDESNFSTDYTRNRIRLELLPYLRKQINPAADRHIAALAASMRDVSAYMERQAQEAAAQIVSEEKDSYRISCKGFSGCDRALQRELLRYVLDRTGGLRDIGQVHIESLRELFEAGTGTSISLPHRLKAVKEYDAVVLQREALQEELPAEIPVPVPGTAGGISFSLEESPEGGLQVEQIPKNRCTKCFDYGKIDSELVLRHRREGDYMVIGQGQRKSLHRILIDDKIPRSMRDSILLLADGSHILWIPAAGRISEAVKITAQTRQILYAQILPGQDENKRPGGAES